MKLGISSTCLWTLRPVDGIRFAKKLGIHSFELWADHFFLHKDTAKEIRDVLEETGIIPTVHAASWDINITSTSEDAQEFAIWQVKRSIDLAGEIGAGIITVHPGKKSFFRIDRDEVFKVQREVFHGLLNYSRGKNVNICMENIENTEREVMVTEVDFLDFFSGLHDGPCITMDIAHLGEVEKVQKFYSALKEKVRHIHISDFNHDEMHLPMGEGSLRPERVLSFLKDTYRGIFSLEYFGDDRAGETIERSILYMKNLGEKIRYL